MLAQFKGIANFRADPDGVHICCTNGRPLGCSRSLFLQPVIRLYAVPFSAFTGEDEEEGAASEEEVEP